MNVRTGVVIVGIISLGLLTAACSAAPSPTEPSSMPASPTDPLSAPTRNAESSEPPMPAPGVSWLRVSPEQGAPGATVSLDVACLDNLGAVHSPVLDIGALKGNPEGHQPWHLFGTATVRSDAASGRYQISATCGADELSTAFTVVPVPGG